MSVSIIQNNTSTPTLSINAQTGTTYTLALTDANNTLVSFSNASAITVTVPPNVFPVGAVINVIQDGAGQVTFSQGSGVTINSIGATPTAPKLRAIYAAGSIICEASNVFYVIGDLA